VGLVFCTLAPAGLLALTRRCSGQRLRQVRRTMSGLAHRCERKLEDTVIKIQRRSSSIKGDFARRRRRQVIIMIGEVVAANGCSYGGWA
jgi:hypothetical protein